MALASANASDAVRLMEAAAGLGPTIKALRHEIDRERRLPRGLVETLHKLGFFSLWLARDLGGPELSLPDFVRIVEALAHYDASVAWCASIAANFSFFSGILSEPVARRIFVEDRAAVAGNMGPHGRAEIVEGGYRVSGRWAYASGIGHSEWILGGCVVHDADGPRRLPNGSHETTLAFFPARDVQVIDTWEVGGLRGTGSHDYQVDDVFVPEAYAITRWTPSRPGPLYALPFQTTGPVAIAAVPLGIARAVIDGVLELSGSKTPLMSSTPLREKPVAQAAIGRAEASLRAARAFLYEACHDAWNAVASGGRLGREQRALVRLSAAQAADAAKTVLQIAYDIGGGTSVYDSGPLQRCFRDLYTAVQHVQVHSVNFETCGRVLLGLEPGTVLL
jgi:indole-3-acetate monooxygenase